MKGPATRCLGRILTVLLLATGLAWSQPAVAQCADTGSCSPSECRQPARSVPFSGDLAPASSGQLPTNRDTTYWREKVHGFNHNHPHWWALDAQNGWIFAAARFGMQIWDARADPANPTRVANIGKASFPVWPLDPHEFDPVRWVAAPPGNDDVVAVALHGGGVAVFNTATKTSPSARYGDSNKRVTQIHAARINGRDYAFAAATSSGVLAYDLTAAAARSTLCTEETPANNCGVFRGKVSSRVASYVAGVSNASGTAHWVAASGGTGGLGVEILNVTNPGSPVSLGSFLGSELVHGVALWRSGSAYYLAVRLHSGQGRIYNVSCIASGSCGSIGAPLWSASMPTPPMAYTVHSRSGGNDYVYFGEVNWCREAPQYEWLFRVTDPANPVDITPPSQVVGGQLTGYWGWYYRANPTGFNYVRPIMGLFHGDHFYKAGYSIFDIHRLTGGQKPTASFTSSPQQPFAGDPVAFTDTSTGSPTKWSWTFQGATPETSTTQNPVGVVWGTPTGAGEVATHDKQVTLVAENAVGASAPTTQWVTVVNPFPKVGGVSASPNPAVVCQPVTFSAINVTGKPTLNHSWLLTDGEDGQILAGNQSTLVWDTTGATPGQYAAALTVTNSLGSTGPHVAALTLNPLPPLAAAGSFPPNCTNCSGAPPSPPAATAEMSVSAQGATEWRWNCGDGAGFSAWSSDPVNGPKRACTYTTAGDKTVTVEVRNCAEPSRASQRTIRILELEPLQADFAAQCPFGFCDVTAPTTINFQDRSKGSPDTYHYAWNNTSSGSCPTFPGGAWSASSQPVTSRTFNTAGSFYPCLRVARGTEVSAPFRHPLITVRSSTPPPPPPNPTISLTGPTSGQVNQSLTYSASASNCTPSAGGWSWGASGGGVISGSGSTVSISWETSGGKTVTASNSSCGSATGQRSVSISSPAGGGGTVAASFTVSPTSPKVGELVTFDASGSTGAPTGFEWNFGDGKSQNGSEAKVTHTYEVAGTVTVELEVSRQGSDCTGFAFGFCKDKVTRQVTVAPSTPDPDPDPNACVASHEVACLGNGRFEVQVNWETIDQTGPARVMTFNGKRAENQESVFMSFFNPRNYELGVKILNACSINGKYWVFQSGLTNQGYTINVRDTKSSTVRSYTNPRGSLPTTSGDLIAFDCDVSKASGAVRSAASTEKDVGLVPGSAPIVGSLREAAGPCVPGPETACLLDGRYEVRVGWQTKDLTGSGRVMHFGGERAETDESVFMSFFGSQNFEAGVKMVNACGVPPFNSVWVFQSGLTNQGYTVSVRDSQTGTVRTYTNPLGSFPTTTGDTKAFPCS